MSSPLSWGLGCLGSDFRILGILQTGPFKEAELVVSEGRVLCCQMFVGWIFVGWPCGKPKSSDKDCRYFHGKGGIFEGLLNHKIILLLLKTLTCFFQKVLINYVFFVF